MIVGREIWTDKKYVQVIGISTGSIWADRIGMLQRRLFSSV